MRNLNETENNSIDLFVEGTEAPQKIDVEKIRVEELEQDLSSEQPITYSDALKHHSLKDLNLNERIHNNIFEIAENGITKLSTYTKDEQTDIRKIRDESNNFLFKWLERQIIFLMGTSIIHIFCLPVPLIVYQTLGATITGNFITLITILLKYGFTNYIKDYYTAFSKIIEVLGSVNNVYFKTKRDTLIDAEQDFDDGGLEN